VLLVKLIEPPCTERYARWCERSEFLKRNSSYSIAVVRPAAHVSFARHGRALTGESPEHTQVVGSV
jgi:hypothetical protein